MHEEVVEQVVGEGGAGGHLHVLPEYESDARSLGGRRKLGREVISDVNVRKARPILEPLS